MPTRVSGQMKRAARIRRQSNSNQTQLVYMSAGEFLDYAIKTKTQQGKTHQQAIDWVSNTLDKAREPLINPSMPLAFRNFSCLGD